MNTERGGANIKLEYFSLNQVSHDLPRYSEKPNRIITYLPSILMVLTLVIMIITGINTKQELVSANKSLQIEVEELKKSLAASRDNQNQQKLEALISSNQILQEELKELKKSLEASSGNQSQQQIGALISSNQMLQEEFKELKRNVQSDSRVTNGLISTSQKLQEDVSSLKESAKSADSATQKLQGDLSSLKDTSTKHEGRQNQQQAKLDELQRSTNEVARVAHQEAGTISQNGGDNGREGGGEKCSRNFVRFERAFSSIPRVIVSFALMDSSRDHNTRIKLLAQNIRTDGFDLVGCAWDDSQLFNYVASWSAHEK